MLMQKLVLRPINANPSKTSRASTVLLRMKHIKKKHEMQIWNIRQIKQM